MSAHQTLTKREGDMSALAGKTLVVIGGSRVAGRRIVEAGVRNGARVLAAARQEASLRQLAKDGAGAKVLALDATDEAAPGKVFDALWHRISWW
jgi:NAD(P)-dependent dehydrogenase (short-subunit alcohol dehydrogenase family)